MNQPRWKKRPEGSNWGDFGSDDQLGRVNLIGSEQVLKGVKEVHEGITFCLSLPLDIPGGKVLNPRRSPPRLSPTALGDDLYINFPLATHTPTLRDVISDDQVHISLQYSTQWDSLAHVGALFDGDDDGKPECRYYNGFLAEQDVLNLSQKPHQQHDSYAQRLGVETLAVHGMQGRAVLVDLVRVFGGGRTLVGYAALMDALEHLDVVVERGDMLVLRTGFAEALLDMQGSPQPDVLKNTGAVLDGSDQALLEWITESGIAAICADNYAVENLDRELAPDCCSKLPLHHHCLFKLGLPLAELWYLKDLAEWLHSRGRTRFLLTAPPLRLPGAIGSPVTPVATV
ncbi:cyclase family protein [Halomonas sp. QX-2]|uniref:Cyclase family protein n=1 Tax=Vreelandella sedimenti TaxID=2729618 RepID=A0A7Z0N613_9GAMM|nr:MULTISPECIES: cyclase family protein [Halomonas]NYT71951.1 cyclase family protein [Halomonas sedimenti]